MTFTALDQQTALLVIDLQGAAETGTTEELLRLLEGTR